LFLQPNSLYPKLDQPNSNSARPTQNPLGLTRSTAKKQAEPGVNPAPIDLDRGSGGGYGARLAGDKGTDYTTGTNTLPNPPRNYLWYHMSELGHGQSTAVAMAARRRSVRRCDGGPKARMR
jgi:hypothetical protein